GVLCAQGQGRKSASVDIEFSRNVWPQDGAGPNPHHVSTANLPAPSRLGLGAVLARKPQGAGGAPIRRERVGGGSLCPVRFGRSEPRLLLGGRLLLVLGLPLAVRHAVNNLARTFLA